MERVNNSDKISQGEPLLTIYKSKISYKRRNRRRNMKEEIQKEERERR